MSAPTSTYSPVVSPRPINHAFQPHGSIWAHVPWLLALLAAPFCFGAVHGETQAALASAVAVALVLAATSLRIVPQSAAGRIVLGALCVALLLPLVPLPSGVLEFLSAEAGRLKERFGLRTLALSPADGVIRVWQLGILAAIFVLARAGARIHRFTGVLAAGMAIALVGLAATEFWFLFDGKGIWTEPRHHPGGTFANRNHFASWLTMGAMFVIGALLRKIRRLRSEDSAGVNETLAVLSLAGALVISVAGVIACGSRGGMLALMAGCAVWTIILFRRERARTSAVAVLSITGAGLVTAFALSGELFMQRLTQDALGFKVRIWRDALNMAAHFPAFGVGLGGFETGFSIHKTFHGEGSFLFAENDYLQWIVETGTVGTTCAVALTFLLIGKLRGRTGVRISKAEYFHGALAGVAAFAVHASVEFVGHVLATASLAAALLGIAFGLKERASAPAVEILPGKGNLFCTLSLAVGLGALALPQIAASAKWRNSDATRGEALNAWPLDAERPLILAREFIRSTQLGRMESGRAHANAERILDRALRWRPLSWELRLERTWLKLAAAPDESVPMIMDVMALNPLQAQIPLRFAASLARLHPPSALEVLKRGHYEKRAEITDALSIAWQLDRSPAVLWEVAPISPAGMSGLEEFARQRGLHTLAENAASRALPNAEPSRNRY